MSLPDVLCIEHFLQNEEEDKYRKILWTMVITPSLLSFAVSPAFADGPPTVTTNKLDYAPGETVVISGTGFTPGAYYDVVVFRPDGSIVKGDGSGAPGWDTVLADEAGAFTYLYQLDGIVGTYIIEVYAFPWRGPLFDDPIVASVTFTDKDNPALTITKSASPLTYSAAGQTINYNYTVANSGNVSLSAPFAVSDSKVTPSCSFPATLPKGASFSCTASYTTQSADVTSGYVANTVYATGTYNGSTITSNSDTRIATLPLTCGNDTAGANDVPGQKDLTRQCDVPGTVNPMVVAWNWDEIEMPGGNTADACALFDTDNDGNANYSLCVTWDDTRHQLSISPKVYLCSADSRPDRCAGADTGTQPANSTCTVDLDNDDPFPAGTAYHDDTKARCAINLADVGGATAASFIDVCSYPSEQPNSDPSDCVRYRANTGRLEVKKAIVPASDSGKFNLQIDGATAGTGADVGDGGTTGEQIVTAGNRTVGETAGTNTSLANYDTTVVCRDLNGTGSIVAQTTGPGPLTVNVPDGSDIVCTITNTRHTGSLEVKKDVVPNDPATNWDFAVTGPTPFNCSISGDGACTAQTVNTGSYTIVETAGSGTNLSDYSTTWACTVNGAGGPSGSGTTATVSVAKNDVVVCTFTNTRKLGSLEVTKTVNWNGVTPDPNQVFEICITGPSYSTPNCQDADYDGAVLTWNNLIPGDYTVTETDAGDEWTTVVTGSPAGVPTDGGTAYAFVTNTYVLSKITIIKNAVPDDAQDFEFSSTLGGDNFFLDDDGDNGNDLSNTITFENLTPGDYTFTESVPDGWALGSVVCTGDDNTDGTDGVTVHLDPGEDVVCTFTNLKQGAVYVQKYEDLNANGQKDAGEPGLSGWEMTVYDTGQNEVASGTTDDDGWVWFEGLLPGDYTVCETLQADWLNSDPGGDAPYCEPVTVTGDQQTILFGNYRNSAITIVKAARRSANFRFVGDLGEFTLPTGGSQTFYVGPGTYTVAEDPASFPARNWALLSVTCVDEAGNPAPVDMDLPNFTAEIPVQSGQHVTCTFYNDRADLEEETRYQYYLPLIFK